MTEREKILARIREALTVAAPLPGHEHDAGPTARETVDSPASRNARQWLPPVGESFEARLALFQQNSSDLKTVFHLLNSREEMLQSLIELRVNQSWKRIASHCGELTDTACQAMALPVVYTDQPYDVKGLERCDVGITECDALVAQTGSVLVTSRSAGGRALSVLPPHHVVLARRSQLIADLPEAFALLKKKYAAGYPSFISFITGPSRTGDIERILVLGAHGPKKLTIFCLARQ